MGTFDSIYLNKIKQLQEENRQLRHALQEAGIGDILRLFRGSAVQSAAKALQKKKPTQTSQPPSQPPSSPKPKVPGEFGHGYGPSPGSFGYGYGQPPLVPGQVLPGSGSGPSGSEGY